MKMRKLKTNMYFFLILLMALLAPSVANAESSTEKVKQCTYSDKTNSFQLDIHEDHTYTSKLTMLDGNIYGDDLTNGFDASNMSNSSKPSECPPYVVIFAHRMPQSNNISNHRVFPAFTEQQASFRAQGKEGLSKDLADCNESSGGKCYNLVLQKSSEKTVEQRKEQEERVCVYNGSQTKTTGKARYFPDVVSIKRTKGKNKLDITFKEGFGQWDDSKGLLEEGNLDHLNPYDVETISLDSSVPCPDLYILCSSLRGTFICTITKNKIETNPHAISSNEISTKISASIDGLNQELTCKQIFSIEEEGSVWWLLQKLLTYIRLLGPILVIVLSAVDFIKAIASSDEEALKKAQGKLTIRLIAVVALFLVPIIIELALNIIGMTSDPKCILK